MQIYSEPQVKLAINAINSKGKKDRLTFIIEPKWLIINIDCDSDQWL